MEESEWRIDSKRKERKKKEEKIEIRFVSIIQRRNSRFALGPFVLCIHVHVYVGIGYRVRLDRYVEITVCLRRTFGTIVLKGVRSKECAYLRWMQTMAWKEPMARRIVRQVIQGSLRRCSTVPWNFKSKSHPLSDKFRYSPFPPRPIPPSISERPCKWIGLEINAMADQRRR